MFQKSWKMTVILTLTLFAFAASQNQGDKAKEKKEEGGAQLISGKATRSILDDLENCENWRVMTTGLSGETRAKKVTGGSVQISKEELQQRPVKYVLGVKTFFRAREYANVSIIPPQPLNIDGICSKIQCWVLGRNFSHKLFVIVQDYKGHKYRLLMVEDEDPDELDEHGQKTAKKRKENGGTMRKDLGYLGWRRLTAKIEPYIPQSTKYGGESRSLKITHFELQQNPFEMAGLFYTYIDHITSLSKLYKRAYDGDRIKDTW